jgi:hypothetical protein
MTLPNHPFAEDFAFFLVYAAVVFSVYGDSYYTAKGIYKGFKEGNPINRWLFAKIGQALTGFLEGVLITGTGAIMSTYSMPAAFVYFGGIAALESWMIVRNRKLLGYTKPYFLF